MHYITNILCLLKIVNFAFASFYDFLQTGSSILLLLPKWSHGVVAGWLDGVFMPLGKRTLNIECIVSTQLYSSFDANNIALVMIRRQCLHHQLRPKYFLNCCLI